MANIPPPEHRPHAVRTDELGVGKTPVPQQAAIPDAATGTEVATINAILAALRAYGLIAS